MASDYALSTVIHGSPTARAKTGCSKGADTDDVNTLNLAPYTRTRIKDVTLGLPVSFSEVAIYKMGRSQPSAKIPRAWERRWKTAPSLKWLKNWPQKLQSGQMDFFRYFPQFFRFGIPFCTWPLPSQNSHACGTHSPKSLHILVDVSGRPGSVVDDENYHSMAGHHVGFNLCFGHLFSCFCGILIANLHHPEDACFSLSAKPAHI